MTKKIFLAVVAVMLCVAAGPALSVRAENRGMGLVLSGGGTKGIAHIGVIQAFEDNDIPIDYITGTSMGAIVGALYASGYTPEEMLALIASPGFADWSTGTLNRNDVYYFLQHPQTPSWVRFNLGRDSTSVTASHPVSLINPLPMNIAFPEIFSAYTAQCGGDFNRLFVPFRCVTSDVYAKHKVVLSGGSLADAVRMSMSFPMVFEPIELDGVPMYDGGIYDNYPVDVMMQDFRPSALVGVNVGSKDAPPSSRNPLDQLEQMIMQRDTYPFPDSIGVNIRIDLDQFGLLDFGKYRQIYDIGYRRGLEMADSIRSRFGMSVPEAKVAARRAEFKRRTPEVRITKVNVTGGTAADNRYLASLFEPRDGSGYLTLPQVRRAYYRALSSDRLQNFVPTPVLNPDSTFTLNFKALVKKDFTCGIGGYVSTTTNSMLFLHAGYNPLLFKRPTGGLDLWVGQSYAAARLRAGIYFNTPSPTDLQLQAVVSRMSYHETERLFYEFNAPDFIKRSQAYGRLSLGIGPTLRTRAYLSVGFGHLTDRYFTGLRNGQERGDKDRGVFNLGQLQARWELNTLDDEYAPTRGSHLSAAVAGVAGRYHYRTRAEGGEGENRDLSWLQADLRGVHYFPLSRSFSLGVDGRALLSTRKLLPTYEASVVAAPAIEPTPSSHAVFNPVMRANSFVSVSLEPVYKLTSSFQLRSSLHGFLPLRSIKAVDNGPGVRYGRWLSEPEFFGELRAQFSLPLGTVSAYADYATGGQGWSFGVAIGTFILAPDFLQ